MKVVLDQRPSSNDNPNPFFAIRLYPETNEDMAKMEWGISVFDGVERKIVKSYNQDMMYSIIFKKEDLGAK